ncbi:hypothetical protein LSH36_162g03098 [Paralvinella palmiformis]|uniref:Protein kinase domain-containing protein n=1 Tax=Paralvinella palmiformis TaxID=53620 RepID=A0AAD9JTZ4_9ANNE|nr:hypothetical protein LSH36_162g03098 [Paralvinella palmiformis]
MPLWELAVEWLPTKAFAIRIIGGTSNESDAWPRRHAPNPVSCREFWSGYSISRPGDLRNGGLFRTVAFLRRYVDQCRKLPRDLKTANLKPQASTMCPESDDEQKSSSGCSNRSDCSIDEERKRTVESVPCDDANIVGYRLDPTADGACQALRLFSEKVQGGGVQVGDSDYKTKLTERFAGGSFGELYRGELLNYDNKKVAVKVEPQGGANCNFLLQEGAVYRNLEGGPGIPTVYWFGFHGSEYRALVMDLLGLTLEDLFYACKRQFSMKTLLLLADKMLAILHHVHSRSYVHRDISPSNFVFGRDENENNLFLIDFGHAKKFVSGSFVVPRRNSFALTKAVVGTPRFISLHAHLGHEEGPRDDLEALGYILVYLARGRLPWQGIKAHCMPEKLNRIAEIKMNTSPEELCKGLPQEFAIYINYVRGLKLHEDPDYDGIREMFRSLAAKLDMTYDDSFDWTEKNDEAANNAMSDPKAIPVAESNDGDSPKVTPVSR